MIQHKGFFGLEDSGFSSVDKGFQLPRDSHLLEYNTRRHRDGNAENEIFKNISSEGLVKVGGTEYLYICVGRRSTLIRGLNNLASGVDEKMRLMTITWFAGYTVPQNTSNITGR
jgi:hypothetical protein